MAEGGPPGNIINAEGNTNIHVQGDVSIIDSNIGVVSGVLQQQGNPGQQLQHDGPQVDFGNIAEGAQQFNLDSAPDVKMITSFLGGLSNALNRFTTTKSSKQEVSPLTTATRELSSSAETNSRQRLEIKILKERCASYMWRKTPYYAKACELLEELSTMQQKSDFDTELKLVECYMHLAMEKKCLEAVNNVIDLIKSETLETDKVFTLAVDLLESSAYMRALVLLGITYMLYENDNVSPDVFVNKYFDIAQQMNIAVKALIEVGGLSKEIAIDIGIDVMRGIYSDLSSVKKCDLENRDVKIAHIRKMIKSHRGEIEEFIKECSEENESLEKRFGADASKYRRYSDLLYGIGVYYSYLGQLPRAKEFLTKSIECRKKATDFESETEKNEKIETVKDFLKIVQNDIDRK